MDAATGMLIAVPAALLGAAGFGLATAAQQRATHEVALAPTLSPRLIVDLLARPMWLLGLVATVVGLGLQVVALRFGPIAVVQPLLVTGVAFASGFSALMARRRPDPVVGLGALLCGVGLAAFLLIARPGAGGTGGRTAMPAGLYLGVALAVIVLGCLGYAALSTRPSRVPALALATGTLFGANAGLMKVVSGYLPNDLAGAATEPALYVVLVIGPIGFLLSQNTFQQGRLVAPALAVITTVDPLVAVLIGVFWLGEDVAGGPAAIAGQCVAALVVGAGIALITRRSAQVARSLDAAAPAGQEAWRPRTR